MPAPVAGLFARHDRVRGRTFRRMEGTRHWVTGADGVRIGDSRGYSTGGLEERFAVAAAEQEDELVQVHA
jgi:hypothetical protein